MSQGEAGLIALSLQNLDIGKKTVLPSVAEASPSDLSSSASSDDHSHNSIDEPSQNQNDNGKSGEREDEIDHFDCLGAYWARRFRSSGDIEDIDKAISYYNKAALHTQDGHGYKPGMLNNFGLAHLSRFQYLGELVDLEHAIKYQSQAVSLASEAHPEKPRMLNNLGGSYYYRFERFGKLEDLDQAIKCQSQALLLTPDGHEDRAPVLNNLGASYQTRFERTGNLADIDRSIEYLVQALLLLPDEPAILNGIGGSYLCRFNQLGDLPDIDKAIKYHSRAVLLMSDENETKPGCLNNLGVAYQSRFEHLGKLPDIERAIECLSQAVSLTPSRHSYRPRWLGTLGNLYMRRFERFEEFADINRAIDSHVEALSLTPDGHAGKPGRLSNLGNSYSTRFDRSGELTDIDRAIECHSEAVSLTPDGDADKPIRLNGLANSYVGRFKHLSEPRDMDQAIEYQSQAVLLVPDGHAIRPVMLTNLGNSYHRRFRFFRKLVDIDKAIEFQLQGIHLTPDGHIDKPQRLGSLGISYNDRFEYLGELSDINHAISFLRAAALSPNGRSGQRFEASRKWAQLASAHDKPSALSAYRAAMELVPKVAWIGSTASRRYESIRSIGSIATEAAAAAVSQSEYALALEWLEAGRSIVWNQTLQLRTQFDDLSAVAPDLAEGLKKAARELEFASQRMPDTVARGDDGRALEAAAQRHRRLAYQYDHLIGHARELSGFESFMRQKKVKELMHAAQSGPVVVINLHTTRCDALVMHPGSERIGHVPLPNISHKEVAGLENKLKRSLISKGVRERGVRRLQAGSDDQFEAILGALWHKIVQPVLAFLGYETKLPVDQLPHITWSTTGALSFLPLHAAGCYDQTGNDIYNFAVSSYAPNLGALIHSPSHPIELGGILAVGQEATPGRPPLPGTKAELARIQPHARSTRYMQLENDQATSEAVLEAMGQYGSVHLACHASQNVEQPTESCFYLHNGSLTLAEITKKSLKGKGMAFLSACQTATGDKELPDEAIHLAAGMLVAGYPTVIATMWSISDEDAPSIADQVYGQLVKDGNLGEARVARALHAAVGVLRAQIGEKAFARWAPFVHMGI